MDGLFFRLRFLLVLVVRRLRIIILHLKGYNNIDKTVVIESDILLDKLNPEGIYIGKRSLIASGTTILAHEHVFVKPDGSYYLKNTYIGNRCFLGVKTIVCPGVKIGDECIIGAGSVVTKDIPSHSVAVGVPAKVIKSGISMDDQARLVGEMRFKE